MVTILGAGVGIGSALGAGRGAGTTLGAGGGAAIAVALISILCGGLAGAVTIALTATFGGKYSRLSFTFILGLGGPFHKNSELFHLALLLKKFSNLAWLVLNKIERYRIFVNQIKEKKLPGGPGGPGGLKF